MSRQDARRMIVAYDVTNDARRTRIAHLLERFGDRVQYSVFLVDLGTAALIRMKAGLSAEMNHVEDSILFCDLGPAHDVRPDRFSYLGRTRPTTSGATFVV